MGPARCGVGHHRGRRVGAARWLEATQLPPGYRVWVADAVGTIDQVAPGGRSERLAAGSLLSLPDDWSPEQVVDGVLETFDLIGLDEIPH